MQEIIWLLLLPVAAASGWWMALRSQQKKHGNQSCQPAPAYFKGFNYLINEEPDKAIDVFVQLLEVDDETVETHLALGSLFRRRGETERAIRIHQNLIARPALSHEQRAQALLELGMDYMRAGLYDRAENLFLELRGMQLHVRKALENLLIIYQQERDWEACLETISALEPVVNEPLCLARSHYYCELAEQALRKGQREKMEQYLKQAIAADGNCVRPLHMQARMAIQANQPRNAIKLLHHIVERDNDYVPEILADFAQCYRQIRRLPELKNHLSRWLEQRADVSLVLGMTDLIREIEDEGAAAHFLSAHMQRHPSLKGLLRLIELKEELPQADAQNILWGMQDHLRHLLAERPAYQCGKCGFEANTLHWQCPSCRGWSSIRRKTEPED